MGNSAFIYDAIRTPRSKGKRDGTLHEVKPIDLGAGLLRELKNRHDLDTSYVDDVNYGLRKSDWRAGCGYCEDGSSASRLG